VRAPALAAQAAVESLWKHLEVQARPNNEPHRHSAVEDRQCVVTLTVSDRFQHHPGELVKHGVVLGAGQL